ncbi:protein of unknown function [Taphrina deformans PYCC 5710]|uniref:Uncharacterized protein n=1 Tax=Taphrina deformans (strain PYCC 5710 / ATCC 11124 / CBS 356.35 / IMI 108563 / JCM 9778 / NBRC 8474) TaxID=1097556 RepID=R4XI98_TAPDE|nr:protein of unknown function [Taphrina deformans PYCC 5710]|eukprot:CCG84219.1 protein of unknown function [Taphrina deformans PYCC 5710]
MSLISAISFVPQGHAAEFPTKYKLTEDEFERIQGLSALHLSSARSDLAIAKKGGNAETANDDGDDIEDEEAVPISATTQEIEDELAEYNLEDYDNDEEGEQMGIFNNIKGLAFHSRGEADPYITLDNTADDSDEEEREELQILPTDNIILAAKTEDDVSHLEVYIYEEDSANLYVHHDILLPSFPLCLEWINYNPAAQAGATSSSGVNNVAIGTFEPDIEIWDLDTLDALYPTTILGAKAGTKRRKKKNDKYHTDAVLGLSANPNAKNLLASASADETIKLWDLTTGTCAKSYSFHSDKVSAVQWSPKVATLVATGGYDKRTIISDARIPDKPAQSYAVGSDVENLAWDPFSENIIYTSTDDGILFAHDIRNTKALWRIQAHDSTLSAFSVSPSAPGLIATGGQDKQIKLWSTITASPTMLTSRDFDIGKVFSLGFLPGQGMQLVAGGSNGIVRVWDTMTNPGVRKAFKSNSAIAKRQKKQGVQNVQTGEKSMASVGDVEEADVEDKVIGVEDKDGPESDESESEEEAEDESLGVEAMDLEDLNSSGSSADEDELIDNADFEGDDGWVKEQEKSRG